MKKFVTLFTDSFRELKAVRTITTMAMLQLLSSVIDFSPLNMGSLFDWFFQYSKWYRRIICLHRC